MNDQGKRFLERFPNSQRSAVGNAFLGVIRAVIDQNPEPKDVCSQVYWEVLEKAKAGDAAATSWLPLFRAHKVEALDLARHYLDYERLPASEKEKLKAANEEDGKRAYMEGQPPTEKQIALLKRLKCEETPANRWEASQWIEERKTW